MLFKSKTIYKHPLTNSLINHLIKYPTPSNLYFIWGVGSLIGLLLIIQVLTGVLLAMHYVPHIDEAFNSVERIMKDVPSGWLLRYLHANGSSFLFILLYTHIARGLYYQLYKHPKHLVWCTGSILFVLMAGIAFLGYTLPWGQMSFWGSTVITNLLTAIPLFGQKLVVWIWGGFAINQNTLNRFFSLHYILPILVLALSGLHLILLHNIGSINPSTNDTELDYIKFTPYFAFKDLITFIVLIIILLVVTFYLPNMFGHPDNYIRADALVTPAHIVPEWYFLPFYGILKAFPSKSAGALAMLGGMLILLALPWLDQLLLGFNSSIFDARFKPGFNIIYTLFAANILSLGILGGQSVTELSQIIMQFSVLIYFSFFLIWLPLITLFEKHTIITQKQFTIRSTYKYVINL